jgi:hypothetical protein
MQDFGVVIGCCESDYGFAKGTIASVRHYMPDVPICLLVDGSFPTDDMQHAYGVSAFYRSQVQNVFLRDLSFGYGISKMVTFWEGPFDRFLFLDADTILLGDLRPKLFAGRKQDRWDMFIDKQRGNYCEEDVRRWFFQPDLLSQHFPSFNWRAYTGRYYCTGVWAGRKGIFPLEEYEQILRLHMAEPQLFLVGEMGFLNFMIFRAEAEGRITIAEDHIQVLALDFSLHELKRRWQIDCPPANLPQAEATVLHYPYMKPTVSCGTFAAPMTHFRRRAATAAGHGAIATWARLKNEDRGYDLRRRQVEDRGMVGRLVRTWRNLWSTWNQANVSSTPRRVRPAPLPSALRRFASRVLVPPRRFPMLRLRKTRRAFRR